MKPTAIIVKDGMGTPIEDNGTEVFGYYDTDKDPYMENFIKLRHPCPSLANTEPGKTVLAELRWQHPNGTLLNDTEANLCAFKCEQIWVPIVEPHRLPETVNQVEEYERVFGPPPEFDDLPDVIKDTSFFDKTLKRSVEQKEGEGKFGEWVSKEVVLKILEDARVRAIKGNSHAGDYAEAVLYDIIQEVEELPSPPITDKP